jgi:hypothetical protein
MALQKTLTMVNNFGTNQTLPNVYIKVITVEGSKSFVSANVGYFKEKDGLLLHSKTFDFEPDLNGNNFIEQAYVYLKQVDELSASEDV